MNDLGREGAGLRQTKRPRAGTPTEALERRVLLTAQISGTLFNDLSGDGTNYGNGFALSGWRAYADTNRNGQYDAGEPTALTATNGAYTFSVPAGSYTIRDVVQSGWYASTPASGSRAVAVAEGQTLAGQDFGNAQFGSISGILYNDQNASGTRDTGEPALPGFQVYMDLNHNYIYDTGDVLATADSSGHYAFNNLRIGDDTVLQVPASGWVGSGVFAASYQVSSGANFTDDWGFTQKALVRGQVFADNDNNGIYSTGDTGLAGWTVFADANNNGVLDAGETSAATDINGYYQFGLTPGTYTVREVAQGGYSASVPAGGSYAITATASTLFGGKDFANVQASAPASISGTVYNDIDGTGTFQSPYNELANWRVYLDTNNNGQYDSGEPTALTNSAGFYTIAGALPGSYTLRDVVQPTWYASAPASGSRSISLGSGQSLTDQNFYNAKYGSISGTIYNDQNGSGTRDTGEPALPGFQVYIDLNHDYVYDSGDLLATADASGHYTFNNLKIADYTVMEVPASGWLDSGVYSAGFQFSSGANFTEDWPFTRDAVVRGLAFADNDNNGTFTSPDTGLAGWTVFADANNNGVLDAGETSATTDNNGSYQFGLSPGNYAIREIAQGGYFASVPAGGSYTIAATAATLFGGKNFANVQASGPSSISGNVYNDIDGTGTLHTSSNALANWRVYLDSNNNGQYDPGEPTAITDSAGSYTIAGLTPGSYTLRDVVQPTWYATTPDPGSRPISLGSGQSLTGQNFYNAQYGSVSGTIYNDLNGHGTYEPGDPVLPGFQLFMDLNHDRVYDSGDVLATTDSSGHYTFTNLRIGDYNVYAVPVSGWLDAGVTAAGFTIRSGANFSLDWTFTQDAVVHGFVFADNDNSGTYTSGDTTFSGWTVYADLNNNGVFDPGEPNVTSQNGGVYQLGLSPGTYSIREVPQGGYLPTVPAGGSYTIIAPAATLFDGKNFANVQAAAPAPISGSVYNDVNHNGVRDPGEPGLAGRVVYLDANNNSRLDPGEVSTTTDSAGSYLFQNVAPGTTTLREVLPSGWVRTAPLAGSLVVAHFSGQPVAGPVFGDVQISTVPMDFAYLLTLAQHYGKQGTFASGDVNGDDTVNFTDLLLLAQHYGHPLSAAAATSLFDPQALSRPTPRPRSRR